MATKTVLVVEDNDITREGLAIVLRQASFKVTLAGNGEQALASLRESRPDVVLLDMVMPVLDGWHFLQQVKAENVPDLPIIIVTATVLTREWAQQQGCCGFIRKPIEMAEMLEEIRRCLKK